MLTRALEEALSYLRRSTSSGWASLSVDELIHDLETEIANCRNSGRFDSNTLTFLFAPTGPIQETAIDNGWGEEFLRVSETVDRYTNLSD